MRSDTKEDGMRSVDIHKMLVIADFSTESGKSPLVVNLSYELLTKSLDGEDKID